MRVLSSRTRSSSRYQRQLLLQIRSPGIANILCARFHSRGRESDKGHFYDAARHLFSLQDGSFVHVILRSYPKLNPNPSYSPNSKLALALCLTLTLSFPPFPFLVQLQPTFFLFTQRNLSTPQTIAYIFTCTYKEVK